MRQLSIDELHALRLRIFDNAESLHKEVKVLFEAGFHARANLLAHFACEELGKLPIIVGIAGNLMKNEPVDWKKALKRLRDHKSKVDSDEKGCAAPKFHNTGIGETRTSPQRNSIAFDPLNVLGVLNQRPSLAEEWKTSAHAECFSV